MHPSIEDRILDRDAILTKLRLNKPYLAARYGLVSLALFGSASRGMARADSDIDILVDFDGPATSERYFGVQFHLEDQLSHPIDLVTEKALRRELRPVIERDVIYV